MDTKAAASAGFTTLATTGLKALAGALVVHGYMSSGSTEAFIGAGLAVATAGYSFWKDYGRVIAVAALDLLRAKVQFAAAKAQANPGTAAPSLTALNNHVVATTPAPSSPSAASVAILAIGLSALAFAWASPASAQAVVAPAHPVVHHKAHVPLPHVRPSGEALEAYAATTPAAPAVPAGKISSAQLTADPLAPLKLFTVTDLQAALDDANSQTPPDTVAAGCYTALMTVAQGGVQNPLPNGLGVFQAAQKVRDGKAFIANLQSPTGPLAAIVPACAQWTLDGVNMAALIAAKLGLVVATGGAGGGIAAGLSGVLPGLLPIGGGLPFKLP